MQGKTEYLDAATGQRRAGSETDTLVRPLTSGHAPVPPADPAPPDTWKFVPKADAGDAPAGACLVYIYPSGPDMGTRFDLGETTATIGRHEDCSVRVNDRSVSRHHATVQRANGGHMVIDLQSTNGTFVNDRRATITRLADGDYLRVGGCTLRYLRGSNVEASYHEEIRRLALMDPLTGLHNKRALLDWLDREVARSVRHRAPLAVVLLDIDHFKQVNDRLGHLAGDHALRELAGCARQTLRKEDVLARFGGEEFALVLPETGPDGAVALAERLREAVERQRLEHDGRPFRITVSLGVATATDGEAVTATELIERADANLYRAKNAGRNRVIA